MEYCERLYDYVNFKFQKASYTLLVPEFSVVDIFIRPRGVDPLQHLWSLYNH